MQRIRVQCSLVALIPVSIFVNAFVLRETSQRLRRSALHTSRLVNTNFCCDPLAVIFILTTTAVAAHIAKVAVATLWPILGELGIRLIYASFELNANIVGIRRPKCIAGAANLARKTIGVGSALGGCARCQSQSERNDR